MSKLLQSERERQTHERAVILEEETQGHAALQQQQKDLFKRARKSEMGMYSPWGPKELDLTERHFHFFFLFSTHS